MNSSELLHGALVDAFGALLEALPGGSFEKRAGYAVMSYPAAPLPSFNGVWADGDDAGAAAALEEELDRIRSAGAPPGVLVRDDAPVVLAEARRLGLVESIEIPGMLVRRDELRHATAPVVEVDPDALDDARDLVADAFEIPAHWFRAMYTRDVLERARASVYVLRENGRAVSTALAFAGDDAVGIFNVATPDAERGRGFGAAVTSHAVAEGFAAGASFAYLQSSALGESVYRRLGFRQVSTYTLSFAPAD